MCVRVCVLCVCGVCVCVCVWCVCVCVCAHVCVCVCVFVCVWCERLGLVMTGEARPQAGMKGNVLSGRELSLSTRARRHGRRSRRMSRSSDVKDENL